MNILDIENLNFSYGDNPVLKNVTMKVGPSEFIGIIGPNGAGKSNLLKLIDGIYLPTDGKIKIHNDPIELMPRKNIGTTNCISPPGS